MDSICAATLLSIVLQTHDVRVVFGYPGAAICPLFDALSKTGIRIVTVRQEQMAGHAASGYARISKTTGVCAVTSGPGALNTLPAIATAYMDSIPLVIITGQVSSELIGRDVFQEADITGAAEPFVKHSYLVKDAASLPAITAEAFFIANTGRKGPVLIDIPEDILKSPPPPSLLNPPLCAGNICHSKAGYTPYPPIEPDLILKAATLIKASHRPLICIGGGVFGGNAEKEAAHLISSTNIPFVTTLMGLSALSPTLPQSTGRIGMYGDDLANRALKACDLLLMCGARVGDRAIMSPLGLSKTTVIIHIDIDPAELNKNIKTDLPIVGDLKQLLPLLTKQLEGTSFLSFITKPPVSLAKKTTTQVTPAAIMETVCRHSGENAILTVDVGQHLIWAAQGYSLSAGRFLASGGMGSMGYSLPAGIGASIAAPNRPVIVLCGDGGFQMNLCELATMMQESLPLKLLIFQNHGLGMVRELQVQAYSGNTVSVNLQGDPDLSLIAAAYGVPFFKVTHAAELESTVKSWLSLSSPAMLVCEISPKQATMGKNRNRQNTEKRKIK